MRERDRGSLLTCNHRRRPSRIPLAACILAVMTMATATTTKSMATALSSSSSSSSSSSTTTTTRTKAVSEVFPEARHFVSRDSFRCEFSHSHPPVVRVDPGDLVHVETTDCFGGKIRPDTLAAWEEEARRASGGGGGSSSILGDVPREERNPVTGPIHVNGARPGDVLAVTLVDIRPRGVGVACCGSWGGQLSSRMDPGSSTLRFFDLSECGRTVEMREAETETTATTCKTVPRAGTMPPPRRRRRRHGRLGPIAFPASPMLGVVGVAPPGTDPVGTMPAGRHGGNLDETANGIGSTIYLPVNHPGGLLSIGDMHASQGDGEIGGSGVEIGGDVLLECRIVREEDAYPRRTIGDDGETEDDDDGCFLPPSRLEYPVTETSTHWITHGVAVEDIPGSTVVACEEAAKILTGQWGFTKEEAFLFLGVRGDLGLCQACHPDKGTQIAKMSVPKLDPLCPRPFRALWSPSSSSSSPPTNEDEKKKNEDL